MNNNSKALIKIASPFIPLGKSTGMHAQGEYTLHINDEDYVKKNPNVPKRIKYHSQYRHPFVKTNYQNAGTQVKPGVMSYPMRTVYDYHMNSRGAQNQFTRSPEFFNTLNQHRQHYNSQLQPIPSNVNFGDLRDYHLKDNHDNNTQWYWPEKNYVNATPVSLKSIEDKVGPNVTYGGLRLLNSTYNGDVAQYNAINDQAMGHEAVGHAGNIPVGSYKTNYQEFYRPLALRENININDIPRLREKFPVAYIGQEPEFLQSMSALKSQGRAWGYNVDSQDNDEVTQAFRDTLNKLQTDTDTSNWKDETLRMRDYLNNIRAFNASYKPTKTGDNLNDFLNMKQHADYILDNYKDGNNPHLIPQATEDILYYTTPQTLKGLLGNYRYNNNNASV